jgi:hypothetical protein
LALVHRIVGEKRVPSGLIPKNRRERLLRRPALRPASDRSRARCRRSRGRGGVRRP